jgi:hypothetical protein
VADIGPPGSFIAPAGGGLIAGGIYSYSTDLVNTGYGNLQPSGGLVYWGMSTPAPLPGPTGTAASTGVNPAETSYSLYGHTIPLTVFGVGRIGGEIIAGPWVANGLASFIISFGVPADPSGTRDIREIAFDSGVVWSTSGAPGVTTAAGGTFNTESFTFRFYGGTLSQSADALEASHFGAKANAYRPQILIAFENLPLANTKFGKIPYVSAVIGDASGDDVNLGEGFQRLAASPFVDFAGFETVGVTDTLVDGGLIFAQDAEFLGTIQQFGRIFRNWDILQTDKLRIVDRGSNVTPDITLDGTRLTGSVSVNRQGQDTVKKDLELSTIDPGADFTIVPSRAQRPRNPVAVTTSVGVEKIYLPMIMDAFTRASIVTYSKYFEEQSRKTISGTAMFYGAQIEPGDLVEIRSLGEFGTETLKVVETLHGVNNVVEFTLQSMFRCEIPSFVPVDGWDPVTATEVLLSTDLLAATANGGSHQEQGARVAPSHGKTTGKYYYEITVTNFSGFGATCGFGVGTTTSTYTGMGGGADTGVQLHTCNSFLGDKIYANGSPTTVDYLGDLTHGETVGFAVDLSNRKMWFRLAPSGDWNHSATYNPATNVGGITIPAGTMVPFTTFNATGNVHTANFGASAFIGSVPSGFTAGWPI